MKSSTDRQRCLLAIQGMAGGLEPGLDALVHALQDEPLKASSLEPSVAGGDTELWCFTCEVAANQCRPLEDGGGTMYGHDWQVIPRRSDPTGNAATNESREASALREFDKAIAAAHTALRNAVSIAEKHLPHPPTDSDDLGLELDSMWCVSCHRDSQHLEPVADRYAGKRLCRWCGDFTAQQGTEPPLALLRKRHQGKRITEQDVSRHLDDGRQPVTKKPILGLTPGNLSRKHERKGIGWSKAGELASQAEAIEKAREQA